MERSVGIIACRMWEKLTPFVIPVFIIIIIIIKGIYIAQVRKGHKCAMSAEMAV